METNTNVVSSNINVSGGVRGADGKFEAKVK